MSHHHSTSGHVPAHGQELCQPGRSLTVALGRPHIKAAGERALCPPAGSFPPSQHVNTTTHTPLPLEQGTSPLQSHSLLLHILQRSEHCLLARTGDLPHILPWQQKRMTIGIAAVCADVEHCDNARGSGSIPETACVTRDRIQHPVRDLSHSLLCVPEAGWDPSSLGTSQKDRQTRASLLLSHRVTLLRCNDNQVQPAVALQSKKTTFFYL